ncbi:hypothetical protein N1851_021337 [Merluccius polli]|uniref:DUF6729 domain-containing protein n=1 Tax=Merluccius polli TaxID=89951 RepID=A0AA47NY45_MERPO|nr:hypothetical protein N1851_021337 [Merluccius polli]
MVTETLTCTKCRSTHVSWSQTVLKQLDLAHRSEFRVILTQKFACDIRVIRLLRERGLGNSPTRVLKKLRENHTEEWLHRVARYTTECVDFLQRPKLLPMALPEPPEPAVVPSCRWLEDIQAKITSTYGTILKMDSTRKITKKLAGTAKGTALWLTSVGNEYGQVLMSVLTAQEGAGLDIMAADLVKRYQQASVDPPVALYVDCGCCSEAGETKLQARFSGWPDLTIRLDMWHFMRRLALGCGTEAHQLYPIFIARLSACIFEWDAADLALLREAKRQQLQSQGLSSLTDGDITKHLSREELALHCRRLEELLQVLMGTSANDSLGVPLFDRERMEHIWRVQRKHVKCIQDLPGVALYTKTGELTKGGVRLPMYRCARGSTSLESFHLHLNHFIPGTSANSLNFQIYLLEGLHRWNQDRGSAALSTGPSMLRSYSGDLLHCVNTNYEKLFGRKVVPEFCPPSRYTGELIGVQYLFRQTGQALQEMHPDSEETATLIEEHDVEDDVEEDEGFADITCDPTVLDLEVLQAPATLAPGRSTLAPGSSTLAPGRSTLAPGTSTLAPGRSTLAPGTSTLAPGRSTLAPGSSTLAPGSSTLAPGSSTLAPSTSTLAPGIGVGVAIQAEDEDMAVDDQNVPGYQHVDRLAEYLVELRDQTSLCLSNQQASTIIALWESLDEGDKQQVVYAARHQERLLSGRFRTPKKPSKTPGVESTTCCLLVHLPSGLTAVGLVEDICIRLCNLHPSPVRKGKGAISRWSLILRDYRKIRQLVVGNSRVMQGTEIQLVEVNQNTLVQWHNNRQKRQELSVLLQGTALPPALPDSEEPLQEARVLPVAPMPARQEHQYQLPESTAGQAQQRQTASRQLPRRIMPKGQVKRQLFATATPVVPVVPLVQGTNPPTSAPATTVEAGAISKRPYRRTVEANTSKKCGQFRTADTGHS